MKMTQRVPLTWSDFSALRWSGIEKPASRIGKLKLQQYAEKHGFACPKVLGRFDSASKIKLDSVNADAFVLKAEGLWSSEGVYVLHKIMGLHLFYDVKSQRVVSEEQIVQSALELEAKRNKKINFFIEQRVVDEEAKNIIPLDYKLFTFYDRVEFILQVDRNYTPARFCFFDGQFNVIKDDRVQASSHAQQPAAIPRVPECADQMLRLATDLTKKLKATFISVDCYATPDGAVLGELTHTPGGPWFQRMYYFSDSFELELGRYWRLAYQKLQQDIPLLTVPHEVKLKGKVCRVIY